MFWQSRFEILNQMLVMFQFLHIMQIWWHSSVQKFVTHNLLHNQILQINIKPFKKICNEHRYGLPHYKWIYEHVHHNIPHWWWYVVGCVHQGYVACATCGPNLTSHHFLELSKVAYEGYCCWLPRAHPYWKN
jgi:hypothetical protein